MNVPTLRAVRYGGVLMLGLAAAAACAQEADPAARVQRDASNPLRMIVEAGKLKPRQKPLDAEPAAAATVEPRAVPEKVVAAKPAARPAPQTGTLRDMTLPEIAPFEAAAPAPAATALLERRDALPQRSDDADDYFGAPPPPRPMTPAGGTPATGTPAAATPAAGAPPAGPPAAVERLALAPTAPAAASERAALALTTTAVPAGHPGLTQGVARVPEPAQREALQLADYIEPVVPERLRRRFQSDGEVMLDFTVNADGSVSDIAVRSASDKALEAVAVDAVRQWRYRPISIAQAHGVHLVFKLRQ